MSRSAGAAPILVLLSLLPGLAGCHKPQVQTSRAAAAYSELAEALAAEGLLPLPETESEGLEVLASILAQSKTVQVSSDSRGAKVLAAAAVMQLILPGKQVQGRLLLHLDHATELKPGRLRAACEQVSSLPRSRQEAVKLRASDARLSAQPFFFSVKLKERVWRLSPTFRDERCTRVDVLEDPATVANP